MATDQVVVQLTAPEEIDVTYWKVCRINYEVERADNGKDGFVEVWVAKCYKSGNDYLELENVDPLYFKIEGGEFSQFESYAIIPSSGAVCFDFIRTVTEFMVYRNYIDGTVIID